MKRLLTLTFTLLIIFISNSQANSKLDEKNGFKDFQIGDSYEKWKLNLIKISGDTEKIKYKYTGACCQQVFDFNVEEILLEFKSNKLITIIITLEQWEKSTSESDFADLVSCIDNIDYLAGRFETLFGKYSDYEKDEKTGMITYGWYGNKIALTCSMQYQGIRAGCKPFIILGDMSIVESGF